MQIGQPALLRAGEVGVAMHLRGRDEVAIAVRPDLLGEYVESLEILHNKASAALRIEEIRRDRDAPPDADDQAKDEANQVLAEIKIGRQPRFGDLNEAAQRETIIQRLAAIEARLAAMAPAKIGHNQPPEPIEVEGSGNAEEAQGSSKAIAEEIAKPKPDVAEVARQTTVLASVARRMRTAVRSVAGLGKRVKEKAEEKAVDLAAGAIVGGATLHEQIGSALSSITTWFRMLF
jgi:hypothetical protein